MPGALCGEAFTGFESGGLSVTEAGRVPMLRDLFIGELLVDKYRFEDWGQALVSISTLDRVKVGRYYAYTNLRYDPYAIYRLVLGRALYSTPWLHGKLCQALGLRVSSSQPNPRLSSFILVSFVGIRSRLSPLKRCLSSVLVCAGTVALYLRYLVWLSIGLVSGLEGRFSLYSLRDRTSMRLGPSLVGYSSPRSYARRVLARFIRLLRFRTGLSFFYRPVPLWSFISR